MYTYYLGLLSWPSPYNIFLKLVQFFLGILSSMSRTFGNFFHLRAVQSTLHELIIWFLFAEDRAAMRSLSGSGGVYQPTTMYINETADRMSGTGTRYLKNSIRGSESKRRNSLLMSALFLLLTGTVSQVSIVLFFLYGFYLKTAPKLALLNLYAWNCKLRAFIASAC